MPQSHSETIENIRRIYRFLIADNETFTILNYFRLWPIVFVPRTNHTGSFLFAHQVYWHDSTSLLSNLDKNISANFSYRVSLQRYYGNDVRLQKFFVETLQVAFEPTIDDYLPLLTYITSINDIWRLIEAILRLAFQQNRQIEIKGYSCHSFHLSL